MVSDTCKVMVTPSCRFPYRCADVQHDQWVIYIIPRARSKANIKRTIFSEKVLRA